MHLTTVEIKNFRSLKELRVDLQPGLNVLVGRNNTGKTNILDAIRHALGPSASRGDALWLERDDFYKESSADKTLRTISVTLTFAGLTEEQRASFFEIVEFNLADLSQSTARIHYEAHWPSNKRQANIKRTGGPIVADQPEVPSQILTSLPITYLTALRDAEACLAPGFRSRLAMLLQDVAKRKGGAVKEEIEEIYKQANASLRDHALIKDTKSSLQATTKDLAGTDFEESTIRAAELEFEKILRTLQVQMDGTPIGSLSANGLGYNNLLYIAVVLEHLKSIQADEVPLLLVEEPEAHLHPQLVMLLADYLANKTPGDKAPQTIVTTHSPTLAANVTPHLVHTLFVDPQHGRTFCNSVAKAGMTEVEQGNLQRMLDITRATLYFAKAAILVEGISESLLIPVLARRLGYDLAREHISIIPICGVAFGTFKKLLDPNVLGIPVALVTDADPHIVQGATWEADAPEPEGAGFKLSDRTKNLCDLFAQHQSVKVFHSQLTLEYDLAEAGDANAAIMAEVWESCFNDTPGTFNIARVNAAGAGRNERALVAWRGICRASHTGSKAEFAHRLSAKLIERDGAGALKVAFTVPAYVQQAVEYVVSACQQSPAQQAQAGAT